MSLCSDDLLRKATESVFNGWTALQLAVEHGMGGSDSHAKARDLIHSVLDLFKSNSNIDWQEVADFLMDKMDEEFDTVCEDDSCDEVGFLLWEFHKKCLAGDVNSIEDEISKLPPAGLWLSKSVESVSKPPGTIKSDVVPKDLEADSCSVENMEVDAVDSDPGWTKVLRKKK